MRGLAPERTGRVRLGLVLILAIAAILRLHGIAWDGGMLFHPDERHILVVVNRIAFPWPPDWGALLSPESPWNPQFFAYGSLPIYLLRAAADLAGQLDPNYATLESSYLVGRMLSALFDLGTVALVFRLGHRLYDEAVGLLAAALTAVTVLHVQLAHFYAVDTLLAFFILLTADLAVGVVAGPTLRRGVGMGVAWGMALATKVSAAPLGLAVAAAWILGTLASRNESYPRSESSRSCRALPLTKATDAADRDAAIPDRASRSGAVPRLCLGRQPSRPAPTAASPRRRAWPSSGALSLSRQRRALARGGLSEQRSEEPCLCESRPLTVARGGGEGLDREGTKGAKGSASQPACPAMHCRATSDVAPVGGLGQPRRGLESGVAGEFHSPAGWPRAFFGIIVTGLAALLTFVLLEPYAVIDPVTFISDLVHESQMANGARDIPYTRQFVGTLPYVYPIQQAILWSMGIPLGVAGFLAMVVATVRAGVAVASRSWRRAGDLMVPLAWVLPYLGIVGSFHAKFLRYLLPILPFLSLWAAWMLVGLVRAGGRRLLRIVGWGVLAAVVGGSTLYAVAYLNVYTQTHPWIQTTAWLCQNLPAGSHIAVEHWDDPLPLPQAMGELRCFRRHTVTQLAVYNRDDEAKLEMLLDGLEGNDYIVLASNRLYNTIPRLPSRYPLTSRYYHLLLGEQLGFELVYSAATYPRLFGVELVHDTFRDPDLPKPALLRAAEAERRALVLGRADESYSVYDHPMTLVFEKVEPLSREELRQRFGDAIRNLPPADDES